MGRNIAQHFTNHFNFGIDKSHAFEGLHGGALMTHAISLHAVFVDNQLPFVFVNGKRSSSTGAALFVAEVAEQRYRLGQGHRQQAKTQERKQRIVLNTAKPLSLLLLKGQQ